MKTSFLLSLFVVFSALVAQGQSRFTHELFRDSQATSYTGEGPFDESKNQFVAQYGKYNRERAQLHDQILSTSLVAAVPVERPLLVVTAGGPAAGKSTLLDLLTPRLGGAPSVLVDPDLMKESLPEYVSAKTSEPAMAAEYVHQESSFLGKVLRSESLRRQANVFIAATLSKKEDLEFFAALRKSNPAYRVVIIVVEADKEVAWQRSVAREKATGRGVPREAFDRVVDQFSKTVVDLRSQGANYADEVYFFRSEEGFRLESTITPDGGRVFDDLFLRKALAPKERPAAAVPKAS